MISKMMDCKNMRNKTFYSRKWKGSKCNEDTKIDTVPQCITALWNRKMYIERQSSVMELTVKILLPDNKQSYSPELPWCAECSPDRHKEMWFISKIASRLQLGRIQGKLRPHLQLY